MERLFAGGIREPGWIALGVLACAAATPWWPVVLPLGRVCLVLSVLWLGQSLVRDLFAWRRARRAAAHAVPIRCLCVESALGMSGVIGGALLLGGPLDRPVELPPGTWALLAALTWGAGYAVRDWVIEPWPPRLRRLSGHAASLPESRT